VIAWSPLFIGSNQEFPIPDDVFAVCADGYFIRKSVVAVMTGVDADPAGTADGKRGCPKVTGLSCHRKEQGNVSALVQIFNAIPSPLFSAAAELRSLTSNLYPSNLCSRACTHLESFSKVVLNTASPTIWPEIASLRSQVLNTASPTIWA